MKCAKEEGIPLIGIYGNGNHWGISIPDECGYIKLVDWNWSKISSWFDKL